MGETQIVEDTKKFLEEEGIHLPVNIYAFKVVQNHQSYIYVDIYYDLFIYFQAFNKPPTLRSKTIILAKYLPALTPPEEIRDLFCNYGVLGRLVMPPSGGHFPQADPVQG